MSKNIVEDNENATETVKQHYEGGVGTHRYTQGPCYGYPKGGDKNDKKWFPTRTALKKANYTYLEPASK